MAGRIRVPDAMRRADLRDGTPAEAAPHLRQALTIYQRIGAPAARRVQQTLQNHSLTSTTQSPSQRLPNSETLLRRAVVHRRAGGERDRVTCYARLN